MASEKNRLRPYSEASERNREPILRVLKRVFADRRLVLGLASGTGQHAAYFAHKLPHLVWQASDVAENLPGIREWVSEPAPIEFDVDKVWPVLSLEAVFAANLWVASSLSTGHSTITGSTHRRATRALTPCCAGTIRRAACAISTQLKPSPRQQG
jgi:hypothetical protein